MSTEKSNRVITRSLRLTTTEYDILQGEADGLGVPLSSYMRMVLYERVSALKSGRLEGYANRNLELV